MAQTQARQDFRVVIEVLDKPSLLLESNIKIQVNTDKNISGQDALAHEVEGILNRVMARFATQITRLEVHLSDENSTSKSSVADKRCLLEARLAGRDPASVSDAALTVDQAVKGAAQKMISLLESDLGKLGKH